MNEYELLYIVSPRVPADDVANAIERVNALVTGQGGEVLSVDNWGRRRLAYPIRQYFEGTYVLMTLKMPPTGAVAIEAGLRLSEEVIRHLLISGIIPRTSGGRPREEREEREQAFEATSAPAPVAAEAAPEAPAEAEAPAAEAEPEPAAAE